MQDDVVPREASPARVLVIDDDRNLARVMRQELSRLGFEVSTVGSGSEARELTAKEDFDVILLDLRLGAEDGIEVLHELRGQGVTAEVIVLTGHGTIESAVEAMRAGAREYITKPCKLSELEVHLRKAVEARRVHQENVTLRQYLARTESGRPIITRNAAFKALLDSLPRVARSDVPVLIQGESGTGKELVARQIHALSALSEKPFLAVNCAVLRSEILESELFGHEKGAFTGATSRKLGLFEIASGGTLFLDEIAEIGEPIQAKLLRILQFGELRRVGGTQTIHVKTRIVAATNKDLRLSVEQGKFRQDLFFRINVVTLSLPSLRERPEDVEPLFRHFLALFGGTVPRRLTPRAVEVLRRYAWPGNVRELENAARRMLIFYDREVIDESMVHAVLPQAGEEENTLVQSLAEVEKRHILRVLLAQQNNKRKAAEILRISLKTLYNKLHQYGEM